MCATVSDWTKSDLASETARGVSLVEFFAPWCVLSRTQSGVLEELAATFAGAVRVGRVDVEAAGQSVAEYHVENLPTVVVLKDGQEYTRLVGLQSSAVLGQVLQTLL